MGKKDRDFPKLVFFKYWIDASLPRGTPHHQDDHTRMGMSASSRPGRGRANQLMACHCGLPGFQLLRKNTIMASTDVTRTLANLPS